MQDAPQGLATYPGVQSIQSATYSSTLGARPGVILMTLAPQFNSVPIEGQVRFTFGSKSFTLENCRVDEASIERNDRGEVWKMTLWDRRWKWLNHNAISGRYNVWRDDFTLRDGKPPAQVPLSPEATKKLADETLNTERTPRQLAELCLQAMGETRFDVSALPNDSRPTIEWEYENPAHALEQLCESLGCRITLQLDDSVKIVKVGSGAALPGGGVLIDSYSLDAPEIPDSIAVVCGPTRFQVDFQLEAVGVDTGAAVGNKKEEVIRRIDDLSYKPAAGWSSISDIFYFTDIGTNVKGEDVTGLRALAQRSVYRYYRIVTPVKLPGYEKPKSRKRYKSKEEKQEEEEMDGQVRMREQLLPIFAETLDLNVVSISLELGPARVYGVWFDGLDGFNNTLTKIDVPPATLPNKVPGDVYRTPFYLRGFEVDTARGLVIFSEPVTRNTDATAEQQNGKPTKLVHGPARLVLRASCTVRNRKSGALERYVRFKETGSKVKTGTRLISHDEVVLGYSGDYDAGSYTNNYKDIEGTGKLDKDNRNFKKTKNNLSDVDKQCDYYINAALKEYDASEAQQKLYEGLMPTSLDGSIWQAIYSIGPSGCTTTLCRNSENLDYTLSYKERRRIDYAKEQEEGSRAAMKQKHLDTRRALDARRNAHWGTFGRGV